MDVQAAMPGQGKRPLRQDQPVGGNYHHIGLERLQRRLGCPSVIRVFAVEFEATRLQHGRALRERQLLDRARLQLHAPARRSVRLRHNGKDLSAPVIKRLERGSGELRRASKYNLHELILL